MDGRRVLGPLKAYAWYVEDLARAETLHLGRVSGVPHTFQGVWDWA